LESADIQALTFSSSAFLQSFSQLTLAGLPQQSSSSLGLPFPSAQVRIEGPRFRRASTPTFGPPSGFDYPLDGFRPSTPSEFCFTLTALLGFSPSELHLPLPGTGTSPFRWTHLPFPLTSDLGTSAQAVMRRAAPGSFTPCSRPRCSQVPKAHSLRVTPLGFFPSRVLLPVNLDALPGLLLSCAQPRRRRSDILAYTSEYQSVNDW
jgi:hypothetical protein